MNITVTVELTLRARLRLVRRWDFRFGWIVRLAGICFLAAAFLGVNEQLLLILGVLYLFGPELLAILGYVTTRRFGTTYTYTLTEAGLQASTRISTVQLAWSAFKSIRQTSDCWRFRLSAANAISLPKAGFTPEEAAEWQAFVAGHGLVKGAHQA